VVDYDVEFYGML